MRKLLILISTIATLLLGGCSGDPVVNRLPFVYKIDVQQGNVFTQEMVNQLHPGMTKRQVQFIMGAPLITDPFHADRWDYVYINEPGSEGNNKKIYRRVTLFFDDNKVKSISGTMTPQAATDTNPPKHQVSVVVPPQDRQNVGILTRFWHWLGFGGDS